MKQPMLKMLLLATLAFIFTETRAVHSAELTVKTGGKEPSVTIDGDIDRETVGKAIALADQLNIRYFLLNSGGGDVEAAMQLGRYFRRKSSHVRVEGGNTCASACVFLLAGAVFRYVIVQDDVPESLRHRVAMIGIHRPFSSSTSYSDAEAKTKYRETNILITKYFEEMNIPTSLLDLMNSVPPGQIKWLTEMEFALYFPDTDPVTEDQFNSFDAEVLGISKAEYIKRLQKLEQECPWPKSGDSQFAEKIDRAKRCRDEFDTEVRRRREEHLKKSNKELAELKETNAKLGQFERLLKKAKAQGYVLTPTEHQQLRELNQWYEEVYLKAP